MRKSLVRSRWWTIPCQSVDSQPSPGFEMPEGVANVRPLPSVAVGGSRRERLGEVFEQRLGDAKIGSGKTLAEAAVDLRDQLTRLLGPVLSMPQPR
jgi:hypothetical protein